MSADGSPSWPIIQFAGSEHAARLQHAENLAKQRVLVRHVQQRVLGEDDVEGGVGERQRAGRRLNEIGAIRQSARSPRARGQPRSPGLRRRSRSHGRRRAFRSGAARCRPSRSRCRARACRRASGRRRRGRPHPGRRATDSLRPTAPRGSGSPCRHIRQHRLAPALTGACILPSPNPTQSLAHQRENATAFVEHSFKMAGQARCSCAKSAGRKRTHRHEDLGCHRHRRRAQRAGQRLLSAARRPRRAGRREERVGRRRRDQPLADAGLSLFQLLLCLLAVPPRDHARPGAAALRAAGDLL